MVLINSNSVSFQGQAMEVQVKQKLFAEIKTLVAKVNSVLTTNSAKIKAANTLMLQLEHLASLTKSQKGATLGDPKVSVVAHQTWLGQSWQLQVELPVNMGKLNYIS